MAPSETTQADSVAKESDQIKFQEEKKDEESSDSGPEDNEAVIVEQRKQIAEALVQSEVEFT